MTLNEQIAIIQEAKALIQHPDRWTQGCHALVSSPDRKERSMYARPVSLQAQGEPLTLDQIAANAPAVFADRPHESRSDRYHYIDTREMFDRMRAEGFEPYSVQQGGSRIPGKAEFTKHLVRFRRPDATPPSFDLVIPEVIVLNSHDGTSSCRVTLGMFRFVCLNGMMTGKTFAEVSVKHSGQFVDDVIEGSYSVIDKAPKMIETAEAMSRRYLSSVEQEAFARRAMRLRFGEPSDDGTWPFTVDQLLKPRRWEDKSNDLWRVFNRVQENGMRGGFTGSRPDPTVRLRRRRVTARSINGVDQTVDFNRKLWDMAEELV